MFNTGWKVWTSIDKLRCEILSTITRIGIKNVGNSRNLVIKIILSIVRIQLIFSSEKLENCNNRCEIWEKTEFHFMSTQLAERRACSSEHIQLCCLTTDWTDVVGGMSDFLSRHRAPSTRSDWQVIVTNANTLIWSFLPLPDDNSRPREAWEES